jgi:hypothetical protein
MEGFQGYLVNYDEMISRSKVDYQYNFQQDYIPILVICFKVSRNGNFLKITEYYNYILGGILGGKKVVLFMVHIWCRKYYYH